MSLERVGIVSLGAKIPERVMENEEWSQYVDTTDEWIRTRTGIERRHIVAAEDTTASLAAEAARDALDRCGLCADDIDEIIVATDTPEVYLPDTSCFVQELLEARAIPSFTLGGSGCAGFVQALDIAASRVRTCHDRILVIGVEILSRIVSWEDRSLCVLFGDAAAAAVVGKEQISAELLSGVSGTDGSQSEILKLEVGGTRTPVTAERAARGEHLALEMNGREVFKQAVLRMSQACNEALEQAGKVLDDVDLVVPHQANLRIIKAVANNLRVPMDRVYTNVQNYGNTGSASVPLALWEAQTKGVIKDGDLVLLTAFGAGFHWAAAVLQF